MKKPLIKVVRSNDFAHKRAMKGNLGFSLLEVMVALVILALSFTALVLVQGRATSLAVQARTISIATELARFQLMECKREVEKVISSLSDFKQDGDFSEQGHPKFKWECHAPRFNMKPPSTSSIEENLKNKSKDSTKDVGTSSSISAPFLAIIINSLDNAVRELVVIVRWTENGIADELRVVTHVIDLAPMFGLARMLNEGVKNFAPKKKEEKKSPQGNIPLGGVSPPSFNNIPRPGP